MKNTFLFSTLLLVLTVFSGCEVIGGIFKTGVGVGVFLTVFIIVIVIMVVMKMGKPK